MIALDSSALIAYLEGGKGAAVEAVEVALSERQACLPPVVLTELVSDPALPVEVAALLGELPLLGVEDGYWERAGRLAPACSRRGARRDWRMRSSHRAASTTA